MNKFLIAAVGLTAFLASNGARAESNGLAAVERPATTGVVLSAPAVADGGSDAYPTFDVVGRVPVMAGGVLPSNGAEGPVQTANSLPVGFTHGTEAAEYAQSVARAFEPRTSRARLADTTAEHRHG